MVIYVDSYQGWVPSSDDNGISPEMTVVDAIVITAFVFICCLGMVGLCCGNMLDNMRIPGGEGGEGGGGNGGDGHVPLLRRRGLVVLERGETDERGNRWGPGRYRHGLRLLNEDEVLALPEVEFSLARALGGGSGSGRRGGEDCENLDDGNDKEEAGGEGIENDDGGGGEESSTSLSPLTTPLLPTDNSCHFQDISCTICLEDYHDGEKLRVLPCQHAFHEGCIVPWLTERAPTCPLCKAHLVVTREGDDYDSEEEIEDDDLDNDDDDDDDSDAAVVDIEDDENEVTRTIDNEFAAWFYSIFTRGSALNSNHDDDASQPISTGEVEVAAASDHVEDDPLQDMREPLLQDGGVNDQNVSAEDNV